MKRSLVGTLLVIACHVALTGDAFAQQLYWIQSTFGPGNAKIRRANTDGTNVTTVQVPDSSLPHGIDLDATHNQLYWVSNRFTGASLYSGTMNFTSNFTSSDSLPLPADSSCNGIALDVAGGKLYWTTSNATTGKFIRRANLNGTGRQTLVALPPADPDILRGIALDAEAGIMYWANDGQGKIQKATLSGTSIADVLTGLGGPTGVALDLIGGKIYWTEATSGAIRRANLDGTSPSLLVSGLQSPQYLTLDVRNNKMYWTELGIAGAGKIQQAGLDGTAVLDLTPAIGAVTNPQGIVVPSVNSSNDIVAGNTPDQCDASVVFRGNAVGNSPVEFRIGPTVVTSPHTFAAGPTVVTCAVPGSQDNLSTSFTVTVVDTQRPVMSACPTDIVMNENPPGSDSATVTYQPPTATDICSPATVVCTPPSGSKFPLGLTNVTCVASDAAGNRDSCTFTVTVLAAPPPPTNVVANPGFESGKSPWVFYTSGTGSFLLSSPGASGSNAAKVTVNIPGDNTQLFQGGVALMPAIQYRLTFKAYSSTGHDLSVFVQRHDSPYTNYGLSGHVFNLTGIWQTFTVVFTTVNFPPPAPSNARLRFKFNGFATAGDVYFIDDVSLERVGAPSAATQVRVESSPNGFGTVVPAQSILSGDSITVYAVSRDASNNFVADVAAVWSLTNITGGVLAGDLIPASDGKSARFKGNAAGSAQILADSGALSAVSSGIVTVTLLPPPANLLLNGGFESGTANWTFQTNGAGTFSTASPGLVGTRVARIAITTPGSAVQLFQKGISLTAGTSYRLSFKASCNTGHNVSASIFKHSSPFTSYGLGSTTFNLTGVAQDFSVDFTAGGFTGSVSDARLRFWFSPFDGVGDLYSFDQVKLEALPVPPGAGESSTPQRSLPTVVHLSNFPNPFNPSTQFEFHLPVSGTVSLVIYDILGRRINGLVEDHREAGSYSVTWNGTNANGDQLAGGVYLASLSVTDDAGQAVTVMTNKLLLMK
jgi:hypothetical protein